MDAGMKLLIEIVVPAKFESDVVRDLQARGGSVSGTVTAQVIRGEIPVEAVEGYGARLRSMTAGYGTFHAGPPTPSR